MRGALADMIAETLIMHDHECVARRAAEDILARVGHSEESFLLAWQKGAFDA